MVVNYPCVENIHTNIQLTTETKKWNKTSQELQILSSVTLNCQVTKIVMNSGSQLSEMQSVSQMSQVTRIAL